MALFKIGYQLYGEVPAVMEKSRKRKSGKRSLTPTEEKMLHDLIKPELYWMNYKKCDV